MANDAGGGTSGAKKKIPDDPYFDSSSPAGSNFKKPSSTPISSGGFQNSSSRSSTSDDPYFSNTSPAGSTMSSDKSTWRNTNSGWNVPPSGGTSAQGGGRVSTRQTPDDPYYDSGRPAGSGFESQRDRRSGGGSTVVRKGAQYDRPLVSLTNETGVMDGKVQWTSPLYSRTAQKAEEQANSWAQQQYNWIQDIKADEAKQSGMTQSPWVDSLYDRLRQSSPSLAGYEYSSYERWYGEGSLVNQLELEEKQLNEELERLKGEQLAANQQEFGVRSNLQGPMNQKNLNALMAADSLNPDGSFVPDYSQGFDPAAVVNPDLQLQHFAKDWGTDGVERSELYPEGYTPAPEPQSLEDRIALVEAQLRRVQTMKTVAPAIMGATELGEFTLSAQKFLGNDLMSLPVSLGVESDEQIAAYLTSLGVNPTRDNIDYYRSLRIGMTQGISNLVAATQPMNPMSQSAYVPPSERTTTWPQRVTDISNKWLQQQFQLKEMPLEERYLASAYLGNMAFSDTNRSQATVNTIDYYDDIMAEIDTGIETQMSIVNNPMLPMEDRETAALRLGFYGIEKNKMENLNLTAEYQDSVNVGGELMWSLALPDLTDLLINPVSDALLSTTKTAARLGRNLDGMSDEALDAALKELVGPKADELAENLATAAAKGKATPDTWRGTTDLIRRAAQNTPSTESGIVVDAFHDVMGIVLNAAENTKQAKVILKQIFEDGTFFTQNPAIGRFAFVDPAVQKAMPLYKQFYNQLINASTLADDAAYDPRVILGQLDDIAKRNIDQAFGITPYGTPRGMTESLPAGTATVKTKKGKKGKYSLEYYDRSGNLFYTSDPKYASKEAAEAAQKSTQELLDSFKTSRAKKVLWAVLNGDWMRYILNSSYLGTVRGVARNSIGGNLTHYFSDGGMEWASRGSIIDSVSPHYDGALPSFFMDALDEAPVNPEVRTPSLYDALGRVGKPLADADVKLREVAYGGKAEIPLGEGKSLGISEGVLRGKAGFQAFSEAIDNGASDLSGLLAAGLKEKAWATNIASSLVSTFEDAIRIGGRKNILTKMREVVTGEVLPVPLRELGIQPRMLPGRSYLELEGVVRNADLMDDVATDEALYKWYNDNAFKLHEEMVASKGAPGNYVNTAARSAQDSSWAVDILADVYQKAGLDKQTATANARRLASQINTARTRAWDMVRATAATVDPNDAVTLNVSFFRRLEAATERIYEETDKLRRSWWDLKRKTKGDKAARSQAWDETAKKITKLWEDHRDEVRVMADDIVATTLQVEPRQQLREALIARGVDQDTLDSLTRIDVGDKVILGDTPLPAEGEQVASYTVKQVVDNNDIQAYVIVDANGIERTVKQTDIADNVTKQELSDSISELAAAEGLMVEGLDEADSLISRLASENQEYLGRTRAAWESFDPAENALVRSKMATAADDDAWWDTKIQAGRDYITDGKNQAVLIYTEHPSQQMADAMIAADMDVKDQGRIVARQAEQLRQDFLDGKITRAQYDTKRNELWGGYFEFGHQRWRWATVAGLAGEDPALISRLLKSNSGKYYIPPFLETDDIRRIASISPNESGVGRATDQGDRRLRNSIDANLGIKVKSLDDLTPDQRQAVFKYYIDQAEASGVDVAREWYRYRTPNVSGFTDFSDTDNFFEAMFRTDMLLKSTGGQRFPSVEEYVRISTRKMQEAVDLVRSNKQTLLTARKNTLTPKQQQEAMSLVAAMLPKYDDLLVVAEKVARERANHIMLSFEQKNFDKVLQAFYPYTFFWTRSIVEWTKRIARNPSAIYDIWMMDRAVAMDSEQYGGPQRMGRSVPNILKNTLDNMPIPDWTHRWMPDRVYDILSYTIPYNLANDFVDPSKAQSDLEYYWRVFNKYTPGIRMDISYLADAAFDEYTPIQNGWKRTDQYNIGNLEPKLELGAAGLTAITGDPRFMLGGDWIVGELQGRENAGWGPNFLNAGDVYFSGLVGRALRNDLVSGDISEKEYNLAVAYISTMQGGGPMPKELADESETIERVIKQGAKAAGGEKFGLLISSLLFALAGNMQPTEEADLRELNEIRRQLGYSADNPHGSRLAQEAFDKIAHTDNNIPLGEARQGNNYYELYNPPQQFAGTEYTVQTIDSLRDNKWKETSAVYDEMNQAAMDFVLDNRGTMTRKEILDALKEVEEPFRLQLKEIDETYPNVPLGRSRHRAYTYGMNPFEAAHAEIINILAVQLPGKPVYPAGQEDDNAVMFQYYLDQAEYEEKYQNVIQRTAEQIVNQDGPTPSDKDNAMARQLMGRSVLELIESYEFRNTPAEVVDLKMQQRVLNENKYDEPIQARSARVTEMFGQDGAILLMDYEDLPSPTDEERAKGTYYSKEQDEFIEKNPEIYEIRYYANYPEEYLKAVDLFGEDIFELSSSYPGGGTKEERRRWWNSHPKKDTDRAKAFWSYNDTVRAKYDYRYSPEREAELEALALDWMNQPRPGEPLGGRSRQEYEAAVGATPDLTGLPPAARVDQAMLNQARRQTGAQAPQAEFTDYNQYLATVYPPLAGSMPQGLPRGLPGVTTPGPATVLQLPQIQEAIRSGTIPVVTELAKEAEAKKAAASGYSRGSGGYGGYSYRGRYYSGRRRRGYGRRYRRGGRSYRRYSRGGRGGGGGRRRSYGGGGYGGGGGQVEEGQPLYLDFNGTPQVFARDFASWLYPQQQQQAWRPTGINSGFSPPRNDVPIRPWRRINVRA